MRIVVTGGAGFIGSHVADAYVTHGHEVLIVDNLSTGRRGHVNSQAAFVEADIRYESSAQAIETFKPEVLNLHAAQIDLRKSVSQPYFDADTNIGGTLNLLEAARRGGALQRVIYAASGGTVYGDSKVLPTPETESAAPVSPYGVSKYAGELYLSCYRVMYGLHYLALRYANVFGPRQDASGEAGVVAIFCEQISRAQDCTIYGDGAQTRDFVFVEDVVQVNLKALTSDYCGAMNIGTGVETDINRIHALLSKHIGFDRHPTYAPRRPGEQHRSVLAIEKAKDLLCWTPQYDVERGITETIAWYQRKESS